MPTAREQVIHRVRATLDDSIDWLRFRWDAFPRLHYQPLPWLGLNDAPRSAGMETRWQAMLQVIEAHQVCSAVDIGSNAGWFTIQLALRGITTVGIEIDPRPIRLFLYARKRLRIQNAGVMVFRVEPGTVEMVPQADAILFLAVWHHLVRYYGLPAAGDVLATLWCKSRKVLFFESGESEMSKVFNLPDFVPDARTWLTNYLEQTCPGGRVLHLGEHEAFTDGQLCRRNLFAVVRDEPATVG